MRIELSNEVSAQNGELFDHWGRPLGNCANPACDRRVKQGTLYCCGGCSMAHEMKAEAHDNHDLLSHSDGCTERHVERQLAIKRTRRQT